MCFLIIETEKNETEILIRIRVVVDIYHLENVTAQRRSYAVKCRSYIVFWATELHKFYIIVPSLPF